MLAKNLTRSVVVPVSNTMMALAHTLPGMMLPVSNIMMALAHTLPGMMLPVSNTMMVLTHTLPGMMLPVPVYVFLMLANALTATAHAIGSGVAVLHGQDRIGRVRWWATNPTHSGIGRHARYIAGDSAHKATCPRRRY